MLRLVPGEHLSSELSDLAIGSDAERWMRSELDRLETLFERDLLAPPVKGALERSGEGAWALFEREILGLDPNGEELTA